MIDGWRVQHLCGVVVYLTHVYVRCVSLNERHAMILVFWIETFIFISGCNYSNDANEMM